MTDEQIKRMAEEAGFHIAGGLIMSPYVFGHDHMQELRRFAELARQDEQRRQVVRQALDEKTRLDAKRWEALMSFGFTGEEWTELHECLRLRASARLQAFIDSARGSDK